MSYEQKYLLINNKYAQELKKLKELKICKIPM